MSAEIVEFGPKSAASAPFNAAPSRGSATAGFGFASPHETVAYRVPTEPSRAQAFDFSAIAHCVAEEYMAGHLDQLAYADANRKLQLEAVALSIKNKIPRGSPQALRIAQTFNIPAFRVGV